MVCQKYYLILTICFCWVFLKSPTKTKVINCKCVIFYKIKLEELSEDIIILDDFNEAVLGMVSSFEGPRVVYNLKTILEILQKDGMSREEALEYFNFNILGTYIGPQNPVFLDIELQHSSGDMFDIRWTCY